PTYNGGHMAFGWASEAAQHRHVPLETLGERFEAARLDTRYYGPEVHLAAFMLPGYIHELIA
ncbi:MAG: polyamine aminopropyltransferase, partial [Gemmatimonadetes bacterium]|nr:polyamine aminopropyltransferase [Gemmatimonadota bacterium]NIW75110.1 polyamine aminopropyltransferase [Gemmatimonadota bacterium]